MALRRGSAFDAGRNPMTRTLAIIAAFVVVFFLSPVAEAHSSGGWYQGGVGSSHKGGHYHNPSTADHYRHYR